MKIAFFEVAEWEIKKLKKALPNHILKFFPSFLTEKDIDKIKDFEIISVFIYSKINKSVLSKLSKLKYITTRSMGTDHIDTSECKRLGIQLSCAPHYGDNSVAEHTFALLLSLAKNVHKAYLRNLEENHQIEGLKGFDLKGKTLGVVGVGRIGYSVIKIARGFDMNVIAYDNNPQSKFTKELGFKYVSFNELLKRSDILTLHVPYSASNHHLMNSRTFSMMKHGSILINTARGPLVDTKALMSELKKGRLSGVGLDVIEGEELIKEEHELLHHPKKLNVKKIAQLALDHKIMHNDRVVFTPHIAFYSEEAIQRIIDVTIENILSFIKRKPINLIK